MRVDPFDVGLIPPLLSVYFGVCFALFSLVRSRHGRETLFFVALCLFTSVRPAQYLLQDHIADAGIQLGIERGILVVYAFLPLLVIRYLHGLLKVRRPLLELGLLGCSAMATAATLGPWVISGLNTYPWGVIGKAGPYFWLYVLYAIATFGYVLSFIVMVLGRPQDAEVGLKQRYMFVSLVGGGFLILATGMAFLGVPIYPLSNFMFIPMGVMAYGVLRHRILDLFTLVHLLLFRVVYGAVLFIPNLVIFLLIKPLLPGLAFWPLVGVLVLWYGVNHLYATRIHPGVSRRFNRYEYRLKTAESKFARDLLILRDTRSLVTEFRELVRSTLRFGAIRFFFSTSHDPRLLTDMDGGQISLKTTTMAWLVGMDRFIDRYLLVSEWILSSEEVRDDLLAFFDEYDGSCGVPLVQHDRLVGFVLFSEKPGDAPVTPMEMGFLEKVSRYLSIALNNSQVYQAVTSLKDQLELRRRELSREIMERRRAEESLRQSEERYRLLADNILDTLVVVAVESEIIKYSSPSCRKLTGYSAEEIVGLRYRDFLVEGSLRDLARELPPPSEGAAFMVELEHRRKDGSTAWVEMSGHFIATGSGQMEVVGLARDISERREAEMEKAELHQKLRQAQKMESIGVLAGGIAHDFNNILMAILGYTQLGAMYLGENDGQAAGVVAQIEKAGIRAKELVSQILAFSHQNEQTRRAVDLVAMTQEALALMGPTIPAGVVIKSDFPEGSAMVVADPVQIHQIVVNLCTNAAHALEGGAGGAIEVSVRRTVLEAGEARRYGVEPGPFVLLRVADTGGGMEEEVRSRIFEPYFTTKGAGKGTGMGLAVVQGIILSHHGAVVAESRKGSGSLFQVYLPEVQGASEVRVPEGAAPVPCGGRVLFVDDETMLVELAGEALTRMGFEVVTMDNPEEALACFADDPQGFDVVVTDMTMPRMSGLRLAERVRAMNPGIPVILCTGFSNDLVERGHEAMGVSAVLFKPVPMKDLAAVIHGVRSGQAGATQGGEVS